MILSIIGLSTNSPEVKASVFDELPDSLEGWIHFWDLSPMIHDMDGICQHELDQGWGFCVFYYEDGQSSACEYGYSVDEETGEIILDSLGNPKNSQQYCTYFTEDMDDETEVPEITQPPISPDDLCIEGEQCELDPSPKNYEQNEFEGYNTLRRK